MRLERVSAGMSSAAPAAAAYARTAAAAAYACTAAAASAAAAAAAAAHARTAAVAAYVYVRTVAHDMIYKQGWLLGTWLAQQDIKATIQEVLQYLTDGVIVPESGAQPAF